MSTTPQHTRTTFTPGLSVLVRLHPDDPGKEGAVIYSDVIGLSIHTTDSYLESIEAFFPWAAISSVEVDY